MANNGAEGICGVTFLSDNFVLSSNISITTGAENLQFPLNNLKNVSTARKFRSDGNTVVIDLDMQQTRSMDSFVILGDATGNLGFTDVTFKTSVTTDFSMSTVNTVNINSPENMGFLFFDKVAQRYVEVTITGTGTYAEIGAIFISDRISLPQNNISLDSFKYQHKDNSRVRTNRYTQRFIDELPLIKTLGGSIQHCTRDEQQTLDDMFIRHGIHEPLFIFVDQNGAGMAEGEYKLSMYGYLTKSPGWTASGGQLWNTSVDMEQVV